MRSKRLTKATSRLCKDIIKMEAERDVRDDSCSELVSGGSKTAKTKGEDKG